MCTLSIDLIVLYLLKELILIKNEIIIQNVADRIPILLLKGYQCTGEKNPDGYYQDHNQLRPLQGLRDLRPTFQPKATERARSTNGSP
tara:strand:- start:180 stop:443 length:264 start_codon:yes stop_codon:yes gene_type:complete